MGVEGCGALSLHPIWKLSENLDYNDVLTKIFFITTIPSVSLSKQRMKHSTDQNDLGTMY